MAPVDTHSFLKTLSIQDIMLKKLCFIAVLLIAPLTMINAQKKEIAHAKDNVKAGKALAEAETSMRKLLNDSSNKTNEKIWLVLFDAVRKQYEKINEQMYLKQKVDTANLFDITNRMFGVLEGLDSLDAMPDRKGRIKLNYRKRNAEYLNAFRPNLYNGGMFYVAKKEYRKAFNIFATYIDCAKQPLFESYKYASTDKRLPNAAFYAVYSGFKLNDANLTLRYADIAQQDTAWLSTTYQYMAETYRAEKDSLKFFEVLQSGFARYPRSKYFFTHLFDYYFKRGEIEQSKALCDDAIEVDSVNVIALFAKSTVLLAQKDYDNCISLCDKIISLDNNHAEAYLNVALAYFNQAVKIDNSKNRSREKRSQMIALYRKALPYMQTYRKLAPNAKEQWAMPLYTIYLNLNMGKEFDEVDAIVKGM